MPSLENDAQLADVLEKAVKLLRVGDEGRGTYSWYIMTHQALQDAANALDDAGVVSLRDHAIEA